MSINIAGIKYEKEVVGYLSKFSDIFDIVSHGNNTKYSDIFLQVPNGKKSWLELKMHHKDNLSNPRFYYIDGTWGSTYTTPVADILVDYLNKSEKTKLFVKELAGYLQIEEKNVNLSSKKSDLDRDEFVNLEPLRKFLNMRKSRYILDEYDMNIGELATAHYTLGKMEPAYYLQAGDDFLMITDKNPLNFNRNIPILSGRGPLRVRISTRSKFYEIQAEVKLKSVPLSEFSLKPNSKKKLPWE